MALTGLSSFTGIIDNYVTAQDHILAHAYWFQFLQKCEVRYHALPVGYQLPQHAHTIAGMAAALSPNQSEKTMWLGVDRLLYGEHRAVGYGRDQHRARQILAGADPLTVLSGRKTRTFYDNIIDPVNKSGLVTVDGHMINAWRGEVRQLKTIRMTDNQYTEVEQGIQEIAKQHGMPPSHMQALLWFGWKRKHRILDKPQLEFIF